MKYGDPSVNKLISNATHSADILLTSFKSIEINYNPNFKQVYLRNISKSGEEYKIQFRAEVDITEVGGILMYALPVVKFDSLPYILEPEKSLFFSGDGKFDPILNIDTINASMILKDLSISFGKEVFGADMNNEHICTYIDPNTNRILMSTLISSYE